MLVHKDETTFADDLLRDADRLTALVVDRIVAGEPSYTVDLCLSSPHGDHNHAGLVATAARVVNAIPAVIDAAPGIVTALDLPPVTGKGLYAKP